MAAGLGFKTFTTGEVLTAADTNGYLMQGVLVFASSAARAAAITSPQEGQYSFLKDTDALEYYNGSAWVGAPVGDITTVTAGTGISGGGSSGDVTITNSMATAIDAKGDLIAGTGADAFSRLAVGANDTVLTADSSTATGLKWATAASGGGMTLISTATVSAASSFNFTSIPSTYKHLLMQWRNFESATGGTASAYGLVTFNNDTTTNYNFRAVTATQTTVSHKYGDGLTSLMGTVDIGAQAFPAMYGVGFNLPQTGSQGDMWLWNYSSSTTSGRVVSYKSMGQNQFTGNNYSVSGYAGYKSNTAINRIDVTTTASTFSGICYLFGVS